MFIRICCGGVEWVNALGRMLYVRYGVQLAACCVGSGQSPWLIPCVTHAVSLPHAHTIIPSMRLVLCHGSVQLM